MKKRKKLILSLILLFFVYCSLNEKAYANELQDHDKKTEMNIKISPDVTKDSDNGLGTINSSQVLYSPPRATNVNNLPKTGEIVTSFTLIILGLSLLVFVLGIFINKYILTDYIETEVYIWKNIYGL